VYAVYVEINVHRIEETAKEHQEEDGFVLEEFSALCDIEAIGASCRYVCLLQ